MRSGDLEETCTTKLKEYRLSSRLMDIKTVRQVQVRCGGGGTENVSEDKWDR